MYARPPPDSDFFLLPRVAQAPQAPDGKAGLGKGPPRERSKGILPVQFWIFSAAPRAGGRSGQCDGAARVAGVVARAAPPSSRRRALEHVGLEELECVHNLHEGVETAVNITIDVTVGGQSPAVCRSRA